MIISLFEIQKEVDSHIIDKIKIPFNETLGKRKVAFHVELSELANEIGFFKYWKESHKKNHDRILDEWADCLAFLNSIVITQGCENVCDSYLNNWLVESGLSVHYHYDRLHKNKLYDVTDYEYAYMDLFKLGFCMGYGKDELINAYIKKTKENIRRAKEGY